MIEPPIYLPFPPPLSLFFISPISRVTRYESRYVQTRAFEAGNNFPRWYKREFHFRAFRLNFCYVVSVNWNNYTRASGQRERERKGWVISRWTDYYEASANGAKNTKNERAGFKVNPNDRFAVNNSRIILVRGRRSRICIPTTSLRAISPIRGNLRGARHFVRTKGAASRFGKIVGVHNVEEHRFIVWKTRIQPVELVRPVLKIAFVEEWREGGS